MRPATKPAARFQVLLTGILALAVGAITSLSAVAQSSGDSSLRSGKAAIALSATLPAQLRLSLSDVALDLNVADPTQSSATVKVAVTSSWVLDSASNNVELVGFFDSPAAAMCDNAGHAIPADHVLGGLAGSEMGAFTESSRAGTANASHTFFRQAISRINQDASRTDMLNIELKRIDDLGSPAGEYRGVLHLRLVAY
jgi:hypothetical protein